MKHVETKMITDGMWQHPVKAIALCDDGKIRTVRLNQQASNAFAWQGRTTLQGKTITGYVHPDENGTIRFSEYTK
jgi:hypothetical protein